MLLGSTILLAISIYAFTQTSVLATSISDNEEGRKHERFVPLVAFRCGYRNKFMNKNGEWQDDPSSAAGCLQGKYDILKYCKRVYPNDQISNIVEYSHISHIENWCKEDGSDCHSQFTIRPYRCIGEFVTESLQVPAKCHFGHVAGKNKCNDYKHWNVEAENQCASKKDAESKRPMRLRSFAILEPCGLGMFRGVEYVCCPKTAEDIKNDPVNLEKRSDDDEYGDDDDEEEDEEDDDGEEPTDSKSKLGEQDPYFKEVAGENEHERFRDATERLEKKHRKKVTKVITEWSDLFDRYNKMKETDPNGAENYKRDMTAKFRKTISSLDDEYKEQKKQFEDLHEERVQIALNEKKRQATHDYRAALAVQVGEGNKENVLKTLKAYIKAEEKDRIHMLNRYRHLLQTDSQAAIQYEPVILHRLRYIDLRINGTLAMLRDFPELVKEIHPIAVKYWSDYRRGNTPIAVEEHSELTRYLTDDEKNEQLIRLYKKTYGRERSADSQITFIEPAEISDKNSKAILATQKTMTAFKKKSEKKVLSGIDEDSDEDQFEEEDDDLPLVPTKSSTNSKSPSSIMIHKIQPEFHVELMKDKKTDSEKKIQKVPIQDSSDDEDDTGANSDEASSEYVESNRKKANKERELPVLTLKKGGTIDIDDERELRIAIEPIMMATKEEISGEPKYREEEEQQEDEDAFLHKWIRQAYLLIGILGTLLVVLLVLLFVRRLFRGPRYVQIDIQNPEEKPIGLQFNGYENPTFKFFETKHQLKQPV